MTRSAAKAEKTDLGGVVRPLKLNIGIENADRETIAGHLSEILVETYKLLVKTHVAHWNVVGPLFMPVHKMTEEQYENLFEAADAIAERIRSLGLPSPNLKKSSIQLGEIKIHQANETTREMIEDLTSDHEKMSRAIRKAAENAEESKDFATHDLLVSRLAFHEQAIWMLRATIEE